MADGGVTFSPDGCVGPATVTVVHVPVPPSVNKLFRNVPGKGRAKTREYRDWQAVARRELRRQKPTFFDGKVVILITVERHDKSSDIDNRVKALLDALKGIVIVDDKHVVAFATCWAPKDIGVARIAVMPACDLGLTFRLHADGGSGGWFLNPPNGA